MDAAPDFDPKNSFYQDQIKQNLVINVYKNNKWGTYRHLLLEELEEVETEHCVVGTTSVGDLSSLRLIKGPLTSETSLRKGSKLIYVKLILAMSDSVVDFEMFQVYNFSLNFKDIMLASGRINADLFTPNRIGQQFPLGFEVSGRDSSGRRVIAVTNNAPLASLVVAEEDLILNVPESWSLEDASTIPLVYFTVIYALLWDNLLKPGTSILIHSATGGVGIAALNVCLYHGCDIFVTVGTEEKRNYLKEHFPQIPDSHIGNSRDTSFEEMIKIQTNGRGVDIVLNSLIDDKLKASIRCMARGGRFIEIGKFDLSIDTSLNLLLMEREISYHGVMMDQVFQNAIPIIIRLFKKIDDGIKLGYVKPLPRTVFKIDEVEAAFRYMTTGKHIGKIVVKTREEEQQKVITPSKMLYSGIPRFHCHPEKSYIIVGGLGGVGMELADWLMLRGVKKLILVSSSGIRSGYQTQRISIWKSYGVNVHISKKDVTTKKGCYDLIKESNELGPIDAVFNLAAVLKDALFEDQTKENYRISLAPKASATLHLDEVTRELCPNLRFSL
ncbi:adh short, ADH zinc N and/or KR domain containing protein [Asbolus verrucosus]|uniref:Adh short, ADH zinc N and/or KR domain containing protein n=1 Tax=Asbolus verrucosus TaxID=1661398 RepID=A0A482WAH3_ASBVE|nr:adh short, ADH zinc N and/or KR domain containing protein [Asbolus verrucosus]